MFWVKMGVIVLIIVFLLFLFFYFIRIKLFLNLLVEGKNVEFKADVYIWRFRVFKLILPSLDLEEEPLELILKSQNNVTGKEDIGLSVEDLGQQWQKGMDIWNVLKKQKRLVQLFTLSDFSWTTVIGCEQADWTAMAAGIIWAMKSNVIGLLYSTFKMNDLIYDVHPRFNQWIFEMHFSCMISFRLGKTIAQVFRIHRQYKRRRSRRGRASYTRVNEDSA